MNTLEERDNSLGYVQYESLLKMVFDVVKRNPTMFHSTSEYLTIDIDEIAKAAVAKIGTSNSLLPFDNIHGTRFASVNFANVQARHQFTADIERISNQLQTHLESELKDTMQGLSLSQYATSLLAESRNFQGSTAAGAGLRYPFSAQTLQEERLRLRSRVGGEQSWLKGHKLTISIGNINDFDTQLINGICNHIEDNCSEGSEEDLEHIRAILERDAQEPRSDLSRLKRIVSKESLGRLQKEAKLRYLEYLRDGIGDGKGKDKGEAGFALLHNMIGRLRSLEKYVNDPKYSDDHFSVNYSGFTVNYRDLFARADAFDILPIISDIEGTLGETFDKDRGEQAFTSGIKLKLNGAVQAYNIDNTFNYYLMLLDPTSEEHKKRLNSPFNQKFVEKVLRILLLYYFVFYKLDEKLFNPIDSIEDQRGALRILSGDNNEPNKIKLLQGLKNNLISPQVKNQIISIRDTLKKFITNATTGPEKHEYLVHLSLERGILEQDPSSLLLEKRFFRDVLSERGLEALKYLTIEEADAGGNAFCTLPVTLTFDPLYYFSAQEAPRAFRMEYDIQGYHLLPVLFSPNEARSRNVSQQFYKNHRRIVMQYQPGIPYAPDSRQAFVYRFTFSLVAYTCLKLLLDSTQVGMNKPKSVFVPIVLLHIHQKAEEGDFSDEGGIIHSLSKVLSHMLASEYLSNSQGFYIDDLDTRTQQPGSKFKLANGLSSLYSTLPKRFKLDMPTLITIPATIASSHSTPKLDKVAMIIVSSRKSDFNGNVPTYISNVYGEVIGLERVKDQYIRVELLNTFSANQESDRMYRVPTAINDEIEKCYKLGYRHFLYIAKAPYTSMLHITRPDEDEEMFFMSKDIIQALTAGRSDCSIYPLYCDKYYVVNLNKHQNPPALYVDDTRELTSLVTDPRQSSVVFFNLFNGLSVNKQAVYNGVVSYATLVNIYDNIIYDQYIRTNLLDGNQPGSLKAEILDFLTLVHFSRYEKEKAITFKLEPYQNIIGIESVGSLSLFSHALSHVRFNTLAFLTEVKGVLNRRGLASTGI